VADPLERLALFARALRDEGLSVGPGRTADFCRAAACLEPRDLYWAGRATLVSRRDELPVYDRVFRAFFGDERSPPRRERRAAAAARARLVRRTVVDRPGAEPRRALASSVELLRRKTLAECSPEELAVLARAMRPPVPLRRTRRRRPARAGEPDLRRTLRRALRTGGEPVSRAWRERARRPRRLVLLLDVSGSMAEHSRSLLILAHAILRADRRAEAFAFGTRLTPLTRALRVSDPDEALRRAAEEVFDWDGGTRIGESLKAFLGRYGHAGLARGAVVVVCSDGLEVGDPELLDAQMARLARLAHRVVWLNPLKAHPDYEPLARGMAAALPHVDVFAAGDTLAGLEEVARRLRASSSAS
jgi:uncharacterized protein with von Willebrand factor type A (vWA) domain